MDNYFFFWAQSLDNKSDIVATIEKSQTFHILTDKFEIGKAKDNINRIVSQKENEFSGIGINIYYKGLEFVIETTPNELDFGNRPSPIEIYGQIPVQETLEDWLENVDRSIKKFLLEINRSMDEQKMKEIKKGLLFIENKKKLEKEFREFLIKLLVSFVTPFIVEWAIQLTTPPFIVEWAIQQKTPTPLFIKLPMTQITVLIAVNNVIMLILLQLPILLQMSLYNRKMTK